MDPRRHPELVGLPVIVEFLETGLVPRFPTAIAALGFMLVAAVCAAAALIIDSVVTGRREAKRLVYLGIAAPGERHRIATPAREDYQPHPDGDDTPALP